MSRARPDRWRGRRLAALIALVAAAGCDSTGTYTVVIEFRSANLASQASWIQLALVPSCAEQATEGLLPASAVAAQVIRRNASPSVLGRVPAGDYGLYAVAGDDACQSVAAGCEPVSLRGSGGQALTVTLDARLGTLCDEAQCAQGICAARGPCPGGACVSAPDACSGANCVGGGGPTADSGPPAGRDAGPATLCPVGTSAGRIDCGSQSCSDLDLGTHCLTCGPGKSCSFTCPSGSTCDVYLPATDSAVLNLTCDRARCLVAGGPQARFEQVRCVNGADCALDCRPAASRCDFSCLDSSCVLYDSSMNLASFQCLQEGTQLGTQVCPGGSAQICPGTPCPG